MDTSMSAYVTASQKGVRRLLLTHKGIQSIPLFPSPLTSLEHLDLRHNDISSLGGLASFPRLKVLLLSYNQLSLLSELTYLSVLPLLTTADLQGNPVTHHFSYRDILVLACKSLRLLDEVEITAEEVEIVQERCAEKERFIEEIIGNEETIAKLEHLQKQMKVHLELVSTGNLVDYSPFSVTKLLSNLQLNWPPELTSIIRDSLELKVTERLRDSLQDWQALYIECIDRQTDFILTLTQNCQKSAENCFNLWSKNAISVRDWSLGPRKSGSDFGLETLSFELESVLTEHRQLQETTVIQQRQLAAILARNEELEGNLAFLKYKKSENAIIKETIDEGIWYVVEKFRDFRVKKFGFGGMKKAAKVGKMRKMFELERKEKYGLKMKNLCFAGWKWAAKIEKFIKFRAFKYHRNLLKCLIRAWLRITNIQNSSDRLINRNNFDKKRLILHFWSLFSLIRRDKQIKITTSLLFYSKNLVKRVLKAWKFTACHQLPSIYSRNLHNDYLKLLTIRIFRDKTLTKNANLTKAIRHKNSLFAKKMFFAMKMNYILQEKKSQLSRKIYEFVGKRALNRLQKNHISEEIAWKLTNKANQHYGKCLLNAGFRTLIAWKEVGNERKRRLMRLFSRLFTQFTRLAVNRWKFVSLKCAVFDRLIAQIARKNGILTVKRILKSWKMLKIRKRDLEIKSNFLKSRLLSKRISNYFSKWLSGFIFSLRSQLLDCKTASTRLENTLTEVKSTQSSHQKLRFQLDEDTKRLNESQVELTSRPDTRRVQLLELEIGSLKGELSTLRGLKEEKVNSEGLKKELNSARTLCTTLTAELQKTTNALQSQQTEFHMQANELTEQLTEARIEMQKLNRENRELKEKLREKEIGRYRLDLTPTGERYDTDRMHPEPAVSPRLELDTEERRVRLQLDSLKRERTAIRGEIETRLRELEDSRSVMSAPGMTLSSLGELSVRLSHLESRMTHR